MPPHNHDSPDTGHDDIYLGRGDRLQIHFLGPNGVEYTLTRPPPSQDSAFNFIYRTQRAGPQCPSAIDQLLETADQDRTIRGAATLNDKLILAISGPEQCSLAHATVCNWVDTDIFGFGRTDVGENAVFIKAAFPKGYARMFRRKVGVSELRRAVGREAMVSYWRLVRSRGFVGRSYGIDVACHPGARYLDCLEFGEGFDEEDLEDVEPEVCYTLCSSSSEEESEGFDSREEAAGEGYRGEEFENYE